MQTTQKTFIITGATSGIGLATAELLIRDGHNVIGVGRSVERCRQSQEYLGQLNTASNVHFLTADLSKQAEIYRLSKQIKHHLASTKQTYLDGLVNNAGTFSFWLTYTEDGVEMQWAVNHLAGFILTNELLPLLKSTPLARVVTVSSGSHRGGRIDWEDPQQRRCYNGLSAYGSTKLANILFTRELNRRLGENSNVRAFAADPGLVNTEIGMKGTPSLVRWFWNLRKAGGTNPEVPARNIVFLLTEPSIQNSPEAYWKNCLPKSPSKRALDSYAAQRLWTLSENMCIKERQP